MSLTTHDARTTHTLTERPSSGWKRYGAREIVQLVCSTFSALSLTFIGKASAIVAGQADDRSVDGQENVEEETVFGHVL